MLSPITMLAGLPSEGKEDYSITPSAPEQTKQLAAGQQENLFASSTPVLRSGEALCLMRHRHRAAWRGEKACSLAIVGIDVQDRALLVLLRLPCCPHLPIFPNCTASSASAITCYLRVYLC